MASIFYKTRFASRFSVSFTSMAKLSNRPDFQTSVIVPTNPANVKRQVVFLLGWTNSAIKNLTKYSQIYEREGHAVIVCCMSASMVYGLNPRRKWDYQADKLVATLYERNLQNRPVFFHVFSGGTFMYYLLCKRFEEKCHKEVRVTGTVLDSTLASFKCALFYRAMYAVAPGNSLLKGLVSLSGVCVAYFVALLNITVDALKGDASTTEDYRLFNYAMLSTQPNLGPQLFLFSKVDKIVDYESVRSLIETRKESGVEVYWKMWLDSPHVRHFQIHRDEYLTILNAFREKCAGKSVSVHEEAVKINGNKLGLIQKWVLK